MAEVGKCDRVLCWNQERKSPAPDLTNEDSVAKRVLGKELRERYLMDKIFPARVQALVVRTIPQEAGYTFCQIEIRSKVQMWFIPLNGNCMIFLVSQFRTFICTSIEHEHLILVGVCNA